MDPINRLFRAQSMFEVSAMKWLACEFSFFSRCQIKLCSAGELGRRRAPGLDQNLYTFTRAKASSTLRSNASRLKGL
jgi:hypothetical protein